MMGQASQSLKKRPLTIERVSDILRLLYRYADIMIDAVDALPEKERRLRRLQNASNEFYVFEQRIGKIAELIAAGKTPTEDIADTLAALVYDLCEAERFLQRIEHHPINLTIDGGNLATYARKALIVPRGKLD